MSKRKRASYLQRIGLAMAAGLLAWITWHFPVVEYITRAQRTIGRMEVWGGVLYPLLYGACNICLLPGGVIAMGSGLFFGLWWGFLLTLLGNVGAAAVSFSISRALGRQWVERRFFRHRKWVLLDELIARDGWKIIFLSQVHPLFPTSLLNYLYGVTRIRFGTCLLWIALGQAPGLFLYTYLGTLAQFGLKILRGTTHPVAYEYLFCIGGLCLTIAATVLLSRVALRLLAEAEKTAQQTPQPPGSLTGATTRQRDVVISRVD